MYKNIEEMSIEELREGLSRMTKIAKKMHLWIFLHTYDEQEAYDEIGLTEEENDFLGYCGSICVDGKG